MNFDHEYAFFASNPSLGHSASLELETREDPDMTYSPVSSGIFFPDGYGWEGGGRFDLDKLDNNDQENTESDCCAMSAGKSLAHPTSHRTETYEEPNKADSPVSSGIFFPDGYGFDQGALNNNDQENIESGCIGTDTLTTRTCYFDENGKEIEIGQTCESEHEVFDQTSGEELEVEIDQSDGYYWDGSSSTPQIGLKFKSREEVRKFVNLYSSRCKCKMVIISGGGQKTRKIEFGCTYGHQRKSVATQARPGAHSKKKNCKAKIRFYCGPVDCDLTFFNEDHNHELSFAWFKQDTEKIDTFEEKQCLQDCVSINMKPHQVKSLFRVKFGKTALSSDHISYVMRKLSIPNEDMNKLQSTLHLIEDEGGRVEIMKGKNGEVRVLTIQTASMRRAFLGINPDVCQVDTTFGFETSGYKLSVFMYLNPVTDRGEVCHVAFLSDEGSDAYEFAFSAFRSSIHKDPPVIILDKDFNELAVIKKVFPSSLPLLCIFHVLKWWQSLLKTTTSTNGQLKVEEKKKIMDNFRSVVFCRRQEEIKPLKDKFEESVKGRQVRVGNGDRAYYVDLEDYYLKNWEECEQMWMLLYRKNLVGVEEEFTNNRIERFWRSTKEFLKQKSSGAMGISKAVNEVVKFSEERLSEKYIWDQRHTLRMHDSDPKVREELLRAGQCLNDRGVQKFKNAVNMMRTKENAMKIVIDSNGEDAISEVFKKNGKLDQGNSDLDMEAKVYQCNANKCNCSWSVRQGTPCRHILLYRQIKSLKLFDASLFHERYMKVRNEDIYKDNDFYDELEDDAQQAEKNVEDDPVYDVICNSKVMSRGEKFKVISPLVERLMDAILRRGSKSVELYGHELESCIENVKKGKSLFHRTGHGNSSNLSNLNPREYFFSDDLEGRRGAEEGDESKGKSCGSSGSPVTEKGNCSSVFHARNSHEKFDLKFHVSTNMGKVGRPRQSKTSFNKLKKKQPKGKNIQTAPQAPANSDSTIICTLSTNPSDPRDNALWSDHMETLRPRSFVFTQVVDFVIRQLQLEPVGKDVWFLSNELAQQITDRYWEAPDLDSQLTAAKLYIDDGVKIIFIPWCEKSHYFSVVAIIGLHDRIFVYESIGTYGVPLIVSHLKEFLRTVKASAGYDHGDCIVKGLDGPRQEVGSNNCALFCIQTATMLARNPEDFCQRLLRNDLTTGFDTDLIPGMRIKLVENFLKLGEEQRADGGILQFSERLDSRQYLHNVSLLSHLA